MRVRVKICGIAAAESLDAVVEAGADAVGFVFAESPRSVSAETALALAARLPAWVTPVAVTRHPDAQFVTDVLPRLRFPCWQTDAEDLVGVTLPRGCRPLPVFREGSVGPDDLAGQFVYEGPASGAGQAVNWDLAATLARRGRMILAGGLDADNVAEAIRRVRPWAVDVSSGVESAPGRKDPARIAAFVRAVLAAENDR